MDVERCVMCGEPIPEGSQACPECRRKAGEKQEVQGACRFPGETRHRLYSALNRGLLPYLETAGEQLTQGKEPGRRLWRRVYAGLGEALDIIQEIAEGNGFAKNNAPAETGLERLVLKAAGSARALIGLAFGRGQLREDTFLMHMGVLQSLASALETKELDGGREK